MKYLRSLFTGTALAVSCLLLPALHAAPDAKAADDAKNPAADTKAKTPAKKDDAKAAEAKPAAEVPATHKVKAGPFELSVELTGSFESARSTEIALDPEVWADLTVLESVDHGAVVKKGDILVKLDPEKLEDQIREQELARPGAELALKLAEEEFKALEKSTPINLKIARDAKTRAEEDLVYYEEVTHPRSIDSAKYSVKSAEFNLEYNQEELDQLNKMYAADDLTEETEEIIVKRAAYSVESAERSLESTRLRTKRSLTTTLPRSLADQRQAVEQARIAWRKAETTLPEGLKKARLDLEAQRRALAKGAENLAKLKADRKLMTITAPHDGIVYYGAAVRGKWLTTAAIEKKLRPAGKLMPHEVIITLVQRSPLNIRTAVAENQLQHLAAGQKAKVTPTSSPDSELNAELESLSYVPLAGNTFDAVFTMPKQAMANVYPGMTGKLKIELYKNDKALTVPKSAVKKGDDGSTHVILNDGKKRPVKVGKSNDKVTEILSGLKEGDVVKTK